MTGITCAEGRRFFDSRLQIRVEKKQIPTHFIMYILYIIGILKIFDMAHKIWFMHPRQQSASITQSPQTAVAQCHSAPSIWADDGFDTRVMRGMWGGNKHYDRVYTDATGGMTTAVLNTCGMTGLSVDGNRELFS